MDPILRLCVRITDIAALDRALTYALGAWTRALRAGRPEQWETFAVEAHALRNGLTRARRDGEHCWIEAIGDVAGMLRAVAETCVADAALAPLAPMLRRYADEAATGDVNCGFY